MSPLSTPSLRLLLIEDDLDVQEVVISFLRAQGHSVDAASDGVTGLHLAATHSYDVVILDLTLPALDGQEICHKLRTEHQNSVPLIVISGRSGVHQKIASLDVGADDFLQKPFELRELEARCQALVRRSSGLLRETVYEIGHLRVNASRAQVIVQGKEIRLQPIPFRLLVLMLEAAPNVVSAAKLSQELGYARSGQTTLRTHISALRRAIDVIEEAPSLIQTVSRTGYRIAEPRSASDLSDDSQGSR